MKERKFKGLIGMTIVTAIFLLLAGLTFFVYQLTFADGSFAPRNTYDGSNGTSSQVKVEATYVRKMNSEPIPTNDKKYVDVYLIGTANSDKTVSLYTSTDDREIQALADLGAELEKNPRSFVAETSSRDFIDLAKEVKEAIQSDDAKRQFSTTHTLIRDDLLNTRFIMFWATVGFVVIAVMCVVWYGYLFVKNGRFYDDLYTKFPELRDNLNLLVTDGEYSNQESAIFVYKGHLLSLGRQYQIVDLNHVLYMYVLKQTLYQGFFSNTQYFIHAYNDQFKKLIFNPNQRRSKKQAAVLDDFQEFIEEHYRHILVGVNRRDEFNALRQEAKHNNQ